MGFRHIQIQQPVTLPWWLATSNFQLFDMNGKLLRMEKIEGTETEIDIYKLVPAIYFLKVMQGNKELKIFKIIKK